MNRRGFFGTLLGGFAALTLKGKAAALGISPALAPRQGFMTYGAKNLRPAKFTGIAVRTSLPPTTWRKLNEGIRPSDRRSLHTLTLEANELSNDLTWIEVEE